MTQNRMSCHLFNDVTHLSLIWRNSYMLLSFNVIIPLFKNNNKITKLKLINIFELKN